MTARKLAPLDEHHHGHATRLIVAVIVCAASQDLKQGGPVRYVLGMKDSLNPYAQRFWCNNGIPILHSSTGSQELRTLLLDSR